MEQQPKLLIVNTYEKDTTGRRKRIEAIKSLLTMHQVEYEIVK